MRCTLQPQQRVEARLDGGRREREWYGPGPAHRLPTSKCAAWCSIHQTVQNLGVFALMYGSGTLFFWDRSGSVLKVGNSTPSALPAGARSWCATHAIIIDGVRSPTERQSAGLAAEDPLSQALSTHDLTGGYFGRTQQSQQELPCNDWQCSLIISGSGCRERASQMSIKSIPGLSSGTGVL